MNIQDGQQPTDQELLASMSDSKREIRGSRTSHFFLPAASAKIDTKSWHKNNKQSARVVNLQNEIRISDNDLNLLTPRENEVLAEYLQKR